MEPFSDKQNTIQTLVFNENDFIKNFETNIESKLDRLLIQKWSEALDKNVFKYKITQNSLVSKVLNGKYQIVVQLNESRFSLRRKPEEMSSIQMPFNDSKFNFTRINSEEILFEIKSSDGLTEGTVIINNSPIEFCNSLLIPKLKEKRPQILTDDGLRLAISLVALSTKPSLKVGFNSLGAMASVNHQHFHLYYYNYDMVIEKLPIKDNLLNGWAIEGFVFEIKDICLKQIQKTVDKIMKLVNSCLKQNISHNVFISRNKENIIRVFLWVRDPVFGLKDESEINPAFCEFTGFFICKTKEMFDTIDEQFCLQFLTNVKTRNDDLKHLL